MLIFGNSRILILKLNLRNSGQVVRPGDTIAQIASSHSPLVLKAMIAAQDIAKIATDQKIQLQVNACPYPDYSTLKGVVGTVAPDAIAPQGSSASSVPPVTTTTQGPSTSPVASYFEVTIQPTSLSLMNGNRQCRLQSGMEAKADIISQEETALQFLLRKARLLADL